VPPGFPASSLVFSPQTSRSLRPRLRFPLPSAYLGASACSWPRCPCVSPTFAVYGGLVTGAPSICRSAPRRSETLPGSWAVLSHAPHPHTTPGVVSLAQYGRPTVAFREDDALGTRDVSVFEAGSMRLARSPAYASPPPSPENVARLASEWLGSALSGGVRARWTTDRISEAIASLPPSGPGFPGRTIQGFISEARSEGQTGESSVITGPWQFLAPAASSSPRSSQVRSRPSLGSAPLVTRSEPAETAPGGRGASGHRLSGMRPPLHSSWSKWRSASSSYSMVGSSGGGANPSGASSRAYPIAR